MAEDRIKDKALKQLIARLGGKVLAHFLFGKVLLGVECLELNALRGKLGKERLEQLLSHYLDHLVGNLAGKALSVLLHGGCHLRLLVAIGKLLFRSGAERTAQLFDGRDIHGLQVLGNPLVADLGDFERRVVGANTLLGGGELANQHGNLLVDIGLVDAGLGFDGNRDGLVGGKLELGLHQHRHVEREHLVGLGRLVRFDAVGGNGQAAVLFQREWNKVIDDGGVDGVLGILFAQGIHDLLVRGFALLVFQLVLQHKRIQAVGECLAHFCSGGGDAQTNLFAIVLQSLYLHGIPFVGGSMAAIACIATILGKLFWRP